MSATCHTLHCNRVFGEIVSPKQVSKLVIAVFIFMNFSYIHEHSLSIDLHKMSP